jgi:hypothetical protein
VTATGSTGPVARQVQRALRRLAQVRLERRDLGRVDLALAVTGR